MGIREFSKSSTFVLILLAAAAVGVPFALEQIGEATGLFKFPVTKTISGWFSSSAPAARGAATAKPVDWERYRRDLEAFTAWADAQPAVSVVLPSQDVASFEVEEEAIPTRRLWTVPVASCTARDPVTGRAGYVFVTGSTRAFGEGDVIEPSQDLCGYEIVSIDERSVWFHALFGTPGESRMGVCAFPAFTRVEDESLVKGARRYVVQDAFPLASGGWLKIDAFRPPDGVVFEILDERHRVVASLLCVVIGEKGGK